MDMGQVMSAGLLWSEKGYEANDHQKLVMFGVKRWPERYGQEARGKQTTHPLKRPLHPLRKREKRTYMTVTA